MEGKGDDAKSTRSGCDDGDESDGGSCQASESEDDGTQYVIVRYYDIELALKVVREDAVNKKAMALWKLIIQMHNRLVREGKADTLTAKTKIVLLDKDYYKSVTSGALFEDSRKVVELEIVRDDDGKMHCPWLDQIYQRWWSRPKKG